MPTHIAPPSIHSILFQSQQSTGAVRVRRVVPETIQSSYSQGQQNSTFAAPVQIIALTGSLADSSKHREATVALCDVIDQLHNQHCLSDTSAAKEPNLSSLLIGCQQVDHLKATTASIHILSSGCPRQHTQDAFILRCDGRLSSIAAKRCFWIEFPKPQHDWRQQSHSRHTYTTRYT